MRPTDTPQVNVEDTLDYQCGNSVLPHFDFPTKIIEFKCPKCKTIDRTTYDKPRHCANCWKNGLNTVWMEKV